MTLGLQHGTVRVVPHDPAWFVVARHACVAVAAAGADLLVDVQHIGSTAVPDLAAKPIVDLAAALVPTASIAPLVPRLAALGYAWRGERIDAGDHLFVLDAPPDVRLVHLHVVAADSRAWQQYLQVRDRLRADAPARARYEAVKVALARQYPDDREAYTRGKGDLVRALLSPP